MLFAVVINRIVMALLTLAGVAVIVFILLRVVPGDPVAMMISPGASACRHRSRSAPITASTRRCPPSSGSGQGRALPATSAPRSTLHRYVTDVLATRLPATLELAFAALAGRRRCSAAAVAIAGTLMRAHNRRNR